MKSDIKPKKSVIEKLEEMMVEIFGEGIKSEKTKKDKTNKKVEKTHQKFAEELKTDYNIKSEKSQIQETKKTIEKER